MIPEEVEVIIMTKKDYDRNVKQLLLEKIELQQRIDKANVEIKEILEMAKDYEEVNLVDRLEIILKTLRGEE